MSFHRFQTWAFNLIALNWLCFLLVLFFFLFQTMLSERLDQASTSRSLESNFFEQKSWKKNVEVHCIFWNKSVKLFFLWQQNKMVCYFPVNCYPFNKIHTTLAYFLFASRNFLFPFFFSRIKSLMLYVRQSELSNILTQTLNERLVNEYWFSVVSNIKNVFYTARFPICY